MGIKPLYYTQDDKRLRFASNTQALLATGDVDTSIDEVALHNLFSLHAVVPARARFCAASESLNLLIA
jgi:asparagine synthase (glutamine-hydrolysing)